MTAPELEGHGYADVTADRISVSRRDTLQSGLDLLGASRVSALGRTIPPGESPDKYSLRQAGTIGPGALPNGASGFGNNFATNLTLPRDLSRLSNLSMQFPSQIRDVYRSVLVAGEAATNVV